MYFRFVKKLISPGVASPSDAAPVIFSVESPTNSPPDSEASSLTVKFTRVVKLLKRQGRAGSPLHAAARTGVQAIPAADSLTRRVILCSSEVGVFR
jgi:hypothetical protein